jgi:hypothetical protein
MYGLTPYTQLSNAFALSPCMRFVWSPFAEKKALLNG